MFNLDPAPQGRVVSLRLLPEALEELKRVTAALKQARGQHVHQYEVHSQALLAGLQSLAEQEGLLKDAEKIAA